jgi:hypothetical protein
MSYIDFIQGFEIKDNLMIELIELSFLSNNQHMGLKIFTQFSI